MINKYYSILLLALAPYLKGAEEAPAQLKDSRGSAVVEVTAPLSPEALVTVTDPKTPRQPVPASDGADYLKTIPGFNVVRKGGSDGDPVLRGMAGSRIGILLDGEQVLGGCGGRMDPPTAYVSPEAYDRITVIKGPESVLYGPGQSAGTVLFERTFHRFEGAGWRGFAQVTTGSFGRQDELVDATAGTSDIYGRVAVLRSHSGDYKDGGGNAVNSRFTRWNASTALGWTPSENIRLQISAGRSNGEAAYADRSVDGSRFLRENLGLNFEARNLFEKVEKLEFQIYRNYIDHIMDNYSLRAFQPSMMSPEPSSMNPDRLTQGGRFAITFRLAPAAQWILGSDYQSNVHTGRMSMMQWSSPVDELPRVEDARFRNVGVFTEWHQVLDAQDRVIAGLRADRWRAEDARESVAITMMSSSPDPTAHAVRNKTLSSGFFRFEREVKDTLTLFAGVGHAERFPDYWELIAKESATSLSAFDTRPERTTQLDLGLIKNAGRFRASLSAFAGRTSDFILIESGFLKTGMMGSTRSASITRNIDASTWGGEFSGVYAFTGAFKAEGSLAYTQGLNRTDSKPLAQIPPLEARLGLRFDDRVWSAAALVRAVSAQHRFALNQGTIAGQDLGGTSGFAVFSVNSGWKPWKPFLVSVGIDNLFNRLYSEHISHSAVSVPGYALQTGRLDEPGRLFWAKASLRFD